MVRIFKNTIMAVIVGFGIALDQRKIFCRHFIPCDRFVFNIRFIQTDAVINSILDGLFTACRQSITELI